MTKTLVLIAHRAGARVFTRDGMSEELELLSEIENPDGRLQEHEFKSSRQGSRQDSVTKHGFTPHVTAVEHATDLFASRLVQFLEAQRQLVKYRHYVLVAEPSLLGKMKSYLSKEILSSCELIGKDLAKLTELEIAAAIPASAMRIAHPAH